jgi:chromosome segregation ATPase
MATQKKITIDKLAQMINNSFESLRGEMKSGFGKIDTRLNNVENQLGNVESRLDKVENKLEKMDTRLVAVEHKVSFANDNRMTRLEEDVRTIKTKLNL